MEFAVNAEKREEFGKNVSRRIRREGRLPAILYGAEMEPVSLSLDKSEIFRILKSDSGENTLFTVKIGGQNMPAMIKEFQIDPVKDEVLHVDLIHIAMDKTVRVSVPINITGEAVGVKSEGGFVDLMVRELEVECLPNDIPELIELDISELHLHQSLKAEDIALSEGVKMLSDPAAMIVLIQAPVKEEEVVEEDLEEEGLEAGEESDAAEGEKEKTEEGSGEGA
jgi:large subunit ribosomal protein L25